MEPRQLNADNLAEADLAEADLAEADLAEAEWVIRRPKRAKISEEEAIKWTEEFAAKRKERFIASVRKSKS